MLRVTTPLTFLIVFTLASPARSFGPSHAVLVAQSTGYGLADLHLFHEALGLDGSVWVLAVTKVRDTGPHRRPDPSSLGLAITDPDQWVTSGPSSLVHLCVQ